MSRNKDLKIDWKAPVRLLKIAAEERKVFKAVHITTALSRVGVQDVPSEEENERKTIWFERFVRRSTNLVSQPERMTYEICGHLFDHIPDFLSARASGEARVGVKGITAFAHDDQLVEQLAAIQRAYEEAGYRYETVSSRWLYSGWVAAAVQDIWAARRVRYDADTRATILDALGGEIKAYGELQALLGPGDPRRILAMHAAGDLTIDFMSKRLNPESLVRAGAYDLGTYAPGVP